VRVWTAVTVERALTNTTVLRASVAVISPENTAPTPGTKVINYTGHFSGPGNSVGPLCMCECA